MEAWPQEFHCKSTGGRGGVGNWYLLTPSAPALLEFIVAVVAVRSCCRCCPALKMHDSVSLDELF